MTKYLGTITTIVPHRGFGIIASEAFALADGAPHGFDLGVNERGKAKGLFVHINNLPNKEGLIVGTKISFEVEKTTKGYEVKKGTVTVLELGPEPSAAPAKEKPVNAAPKAKEPFNQKKGGTQKKATQPAAQVAKAVLTSPAPRLESKSPDPAVVNAIAKAERLGGFFAKIKRAVTG